MIILRKGEAQQIAEGLSSEEFECRCNLEGCTMTLVHPDLVSAYEGFRTWIAMPLKINRGYSCPQHNKNLEAQGLKPSSVSFHCSGMAIDIDTPRLLLNRFQVPDLIAIAKKCGFSYVKFYPQLTFLHCDVGQYRGHTVEGYFNFINAPKKD